MGRVRVLSRDVIADLYVGGIGSRISPATAAAAIITWAVIGMAQVHKKRAALTR